MCWWGKGYTDLAKTLLDVHVFVCVLVRQGFMCLRVGGARVTQIWLKLYLTYMRLFVCWWSKGLMGKPCLMHMLICVLMVQGLHRFG